MRRSATRVESSAANLTVGFYAAAYDTWELVPKISSELVRSNIRTQVGCRRGRCGESGNPRGHSMHRGRDTHSSGGPPEDLPGLPDESPHPSPLSLPYPPGRPTAALQGGPQLLDPLVFRFGLSKLAPRVNLSLLRQASGKLGGLDRRLQHLLRLRFFDQRFRSKSFPNGSPRLPSTCIIHTDGRPSRQ